MTEELLLPPWPNELLVSEKRELAIAFLKGLQLPARYAGWHLQRWGNWTRTPLTRRDFVAVRRDLSPIPSR